MKTLDVLNWVRDHGDGYVAESLAVTDLLEALYKGSVLRYDSKKPQWAKRDLVFWGIPSALPVLKLTLQEVGFSIPLSGIEASVQRGDIALGMACGAARVLERAPLFPVGGQPLALASGLLSLSSKRNNAPPAAGWPPSPLRDSAKPNLANPARRVYVFLDDTALKDGGIWEVALAAGSERLDSLVALVSHAGLAKIEPLAAKWESFGWKVYSLVSGHDTEEIQKVLFRAHTPVRRPKVLLAPTRLGKGIPFIEGKEAYRSTLFSSTEMEAAIKALSQEITFPIGAVTTHRR